MTGAIFVAPTSVALPTDGTTALASDYKCLGFTSEEGITISEESSNNQLRAWEGRTVVRNARTEWTEKVSFVPVECSAEVAALVWGDDAVEVDTVTGSLTINHHGRSMDPVHIVIEAVPFEGAVARYCCKAQLVERGDVSGNGQDFAGRQLTFECLAHDDGVTITEFVAFS